MRQIFISQLMRGKSDERIKAEREALTDYARTKFGIDVQIIDSFFEGAPAHKKPIWFLGKSIEKLADAESILMSPDWQEGKGCKIEHDVALSYGIEVVYAPNNVYDGILKKL